MAQMKDLTASITIWRNTWYDRDNIGRDLISSKSEKQVCIENWWQLTPSLLQPVKIPGWKKHPTRLKREY